MQTLVVSVGMAVELPCTLPKIPVISFPVMSFRIHLLPVNSSKMGSKSVELGLVVILYFVFRNKLADERFNSEFKTTGLDKGHN